MKRSTISAGRIDMTFDSEPLAVRRLRNTLTGVTACLNGTQSLLVRMPMDVSEPIFLNRLRSAEAFGGEIRISLADETNTVRGDVVIGPSSNGIRFQVKVTAPRPIWMVEWQLSGLRLKELIIPALGGQLLDASMPPGTTLSYKYPFWWNAQFVVGSMEQGGIWLRAMNPSPHFSMLRIARTNGTFAVTYGFEAEGPLRSTRLEGEFYIDAYEGSWKVPAEIHRRWLERSFEAAPLGRNTHRPEWMKNINVILELWGMRKHQPKPHHTFDDMMERLEQWKKIHPPGQTLLYLPGYANHGIDSRAPDYAPSEYLGGAKKFKQLMALARDLGYRVMLHTNVLAMTFTHPLYRRFKQHQVVDVFNRPQCWGLDIDGDWLAEPYFAYINPGVKAWGDLMERVIGGLIKDYHPDGVFLDQTLLAFNVSRGPNFLSGMKKHIRRMQLAFPDILFAGEGFHEQVAGTVPMAQIHGLDSVTEVPGTPAWRRVHPVSTYVFGRFTRFVAHLLTRHPSDPMFARQEEAYARLGVIPALCLYDRSQPMHGSAVRKMLSRTKTLPRED